MTIPLARHRAANALMRRAIWRHEGMEDVVTSSNDVRTRHDKRTGKRTTRPRVLKQAVSKRQMSRRNHVPGVDGRRRPLCAEHKAALSAAHRARFARLGHGRPQGPAIRANISAGRKAHPTLYTPEMRKRMSDARKGRPHPHRRKKEAKCTESS